MKGNTTRDAGTKPRTKKKLKSTGKRKLGKSYMGGVFSGEGGHRRSISVMEDEQWHRGD